MYIVFQGIINTMLIKKTKAENYGDRRKTNCKLHLVLEQQFDVKQEKCFSW